MQFDEAQQTMGRLTLTQRALLKRIFLQGSVVQADLNTLEQQSLEILTKKGVIRMFTVVSIVERDPVQLIQTMTYICTPLGVSVAQLL